jgi:hypothetical protein
MSTIGIQAPGDRTSTAAARSLTWPHIRNAAKAALVILALMAVAMTPVAIRLWLFFPAIHNG